MSHKKLAFAEEHFQSVIDGNKDITIRRYRQGAHDFKKGEIVTATFGEGLNVIIQITEDSSIKRFDAITEKEVRDDGFLNTEDAFVGLGIYYKNLRRDETMVVIRFKVAEVG